MTWTAARLLRIFRTHPAERPYCRLTLEAMEPRVLPDAASDLFLSHIYQDLFGRAVDAVGQTFWSNILQQGVSRYTVVEQIESSPEYDHDLIQRLYTDWLHRPAEAQEVQLWTDFLEQGKSVEQMEAGILGSAEYAQLHGGGFLTALYSDLLERAPDPAGQQSFSTMLQDGQPNAAVALDVLQSVEYGTNLAASFYQTYLRRQGEPSGMTFHVAVLTTDHLGENWDRANFLGSVEFYGLQDSTAAGQPTGGIIVHDPGPGGGVLQPGGGTPSGGGTPPSGGGGFPAIGAQLADDTAPGGTTNNDGITSDPTIIGTALDNGKVVSLHAGFDNTPTADFTDVSAALQPDNTFKLDPTLLAQVNGGPLKDGVHTLHLTATDAAGNVAQQFDFTFTLDTTPPVVTLTSPTAGAMYTSDVQIAGNAIDALSGAATVEVQVDSGSFQTVTFNTNGSFAVPAGLTPPTTGSAAHTIAVRATDLAGNVQLVGPIGFTLNPLGS